MANDFRVLFRGSASTSSATLYTVPANTTVSITSIVVANTGSTNQTYTMGIDGVSIATTIPVLANSSIVIEPKQVILATGTITGLASSTNIKFHISALAVT